MYVKCEKHSSPLSRHWFGSAIRGRRSRRSVKHSETSHWIIVHHRVSCRFISTWHEHVVSYRSVSFCVVSSCVSRCHSTHRSSSTIADTCGAGISWKPWKPTAQSTSEPVFGVASQSTQSTQNKQSKQKWGILSRNVFLIRSLPSESKDVMILIVVMFWERRWRNPDKAASHPEVAQWHSGSMKKRAWKTLKRWSTERTWKN